MKKFIVFALMALMFIVASTSVNAARYRTCPDCGGDGWIAGEIETSYWDPISGEDVTETEYEQVTCTRCDGTGRIKA